MADLPGIPLVATHTPPQAPEPSPQAQRAAAEFESVFLTEMLQPMFEGIGTDGVGEGGEGEQMFRPMLIEQYAAAISKSGGVGIADNILHELTRIQAAPATDPADGSDR